MVSCAVCWVTHSTGEGGRGTGGSSVVGESLECVDLSIDAFEERLRVFERKAVLDGRVALEGDSLLFELSLQLVLVTLESVLLRTLQLLLRLALSTHTRTPRHNSTSYSYILYTTSSNSCASN